MLIKEHMVQWFERGQWFIGPVKQHIGIRSISKRSEQIRAIHRCVGDCIQSRCMIQIYRSAHGRYRRI